MLVCAKGEWSCDDLWIFDGNGLEEGQDVFTIVYDGGQRLGGGLLLLTWPRFRVLDLNGGDTIVVVGLALIACWSLLLCPIRDGAGGNLEELARVRLAVEDHGLHQKWR